MDDVMEEEDQYDVDYIGQDELDEANAINDEAFEENLLPVEQDTATNDIITEMVEEESVKEEEKVEEVFIDSGFLKDNQGSVVELVPRVFNNNTTRSATAATAGAPPVIFVFLVLGGSSASGEPVSWIEALSSSLRNLTSSLALSPLTSPCSPCTTSFSPSSSSLTSCSPGSPSLSPYGWLLNQGSCSSYSLAKGTWEKTKAKSPPASGASTTKVEKLEGFLPIAKKRAKKRASS